MVRSAAELALPERAAWRAPTQSPGPVEADEKPAIENDRHGPPLQVITAKGFVWTTARLPIADLPDELQGFRILHLSDFHARSYWDPAYDELIARVAADPPDLILFTGDFVDDKHDHRSALPVVRRLVNSFKSRLGMVAGLGNHDGYLLAPALASLNLTLVDHRRLLLHSGSATLEVIGIAGVEREDFDPIFLRSLGPKPGDSVRILMSHHPDLIRRVGFMKPDLFLAGHTHGGQVCLPGGIPIIRHDSLPANMVGGIHRFHGTWLVVNRGFGFSSLPLRLFCPAEVIEIHLRKAGASSFVRPSQK